MSGKKIIQLIALAILVVGAGAVMGGEDDHAAIEATVRDYVDGWYAGDAVRMERALPPDLAKSIAPEFIDCIHLAKTTQGWKIVNVLWEPVEQ